MTRGGKRKGSGRPKNSGKYAGPTKTIRIPLWLEAKVKAYPSARVSASMEILGNLLDCTRVNITVSFDIQGVIKGGHPHTNR